MPFTHGLRHFWAKNLKSKLKFFLKTVSMLCPQIHEKVPLKWPRKTLKKILIKSVKNMKLSGFFSGFGGLYYLSILPTFWGHFLMIIFSSDWTFILVTRHPVAYKHEKIRPNFFYTWFSNRKQLFELLESWWNLRLWRKKIKCTFF